MTIKRYSCTTHETFQELAFKFKLKTHQVRFGPFNAMVKKFDKFRKPWVGEIEERGEYFKLFRTKGTEHTSDLSVHGKYKTSGGQAWLDVEHKIHYSAFLGFAGLALFVIAAFFLLSKKGIVVHPLLQVLTCIFVLLVYGYTFYRDLQADEKLIRGLIYAKFIMEDEEVDDEEEEEV